MSSNISKARAPLPFRAVSPAVRPFALANAAQIKQLLPSTHKVWDFRLRHPGERLVSDSSGMRVAVLMAEHVRVFAKVPAHFGRQFHDQLDRLVVGTAICWRTISSSMHPIVSVRLRGWRGCRRLRFQHRFRGRGSRPSRGQRRGRRDLNGNSPVSGQSATC